MESWIETASKFGIPVALLLGLAYVVREIFVKLVWPFVVEQIKESQAQRKLETERFVETIRTRDILMGEMQRDTLRALDAITSEMRGLREEVKGKH